MALWLFISRLSRLIFDQIRKLLLTYWLHASKYFCFTLQWRENFFNSLPVIHISDSTLLMQETVISFEEVMQTKLKVKLCIFQPLGNPCILQKRVVFQAKVFFSNSWFIVINYIVNFVFASEVVYVLPLPFTVKQNSFLSYSILINWVFFIVIGYLWIISQQVNWWIHLDWSFRIQLSRKVVSFEIITSVKV